MIFMFAQKLNVLTLKIFKFLRDFIHWDTQVKVLAIGRERLGS